jgi:hypothetical protein
LQTSTQSIWGPKDSTFANFLTNAAKENLWGFVSTCRIITVLLLFPLLYTDFLSVVREFLKRFAKGDNCGSCHSDTQTTYRLPQASHEVSDAWGLSKKRE